MYDVQKIRKDFPIFDIKINEKPNTFLDSGASAQKPKCVIDTMVEIYTKEYANVHRGSYLLSEEITQKYENARKTVQKFLNSAKADEIVFTRNATEAITSTGTNGNPGVEFYTRSGNNTYTYTCFYQT